MNDCRSLAMAALDVPATASQPTAPQNVFVSPANFNEGTNALGQNQCSHLYFHLTLSKRSTSDPTVMVNTEDGTATASHDYKNITRTVTIKAGQRIAVLTVLVRRDALAKGDEYLYAVIDSASVPVATNVAVGTIVDDDAPADARAAARRASSANNGGLRWHFPLQRMGPTRREWSPSRGGRSEVRVERLDGSAQGLHAHVNRTTYRAVPVCTH